MIQKKITTNLHGLNFTSTMLVVGLADMEVTSYV